MTDKEKVTASVLICMISFDLLVLVQIPTPEYLNPIGCLFASVFIASGLYAAIGALFAWGQ